VLLEWKVIPTDGHHCIKSYDIQVSGPNGSQWKEYIPGGNNSFLLSGMQLESLEEYTYSVTGNIPSTHTGPTVNQTSLVEVQGMFHKHTIQYMIVCSHTPIAPPLQVLPQLFTAHNTSTWFAHYCVYVNFFSCKHAESNPPTNLSALVTCDSQGYKIKIEWKV